MVATSINYNVDEGEVVFVVTRKLDTGDTEDDFLMPLDSKFDMAWAVNSSTNNIGRRHTDRDSLKKVQLSSKVGTPTWGVVEDVKKDDVTEEETDQEPEAETEESTDTEESWANFNKLVLTPVASLLVLGLFLN